MSLSIEQLQFLASKGLSIQEVIEFASLTGERSKGAERQARYRARLGITETEWAILRAAVFERDNYRCTYCGADEDLACDHMVPLMKGGASDLENLTTACRTCNSSKRDKTLEEWECRNEGI